MLFRSSKDGTVWATFYHREDERPRSINFRLKKLAEDSFRLELVQGNQEASDDDPVQKTYEQIISRLRVSMNGEVLSKSAIYEVKLKGRGIKGLSAKAYFDYFHDQLVENGWLIETEEKGKFEFNGR